MRIHLRKKLPDGVEDVTDDYNKNKGQNYDDDIDHYCVLEAKHSYILIDQDDVTDPRDCDGYLGTMICYHPHWDLGDSHGLLPWKMDAHEFFDWFTEHRKEFIFLPLYIYDHSGITMSYRGTDWPYNDMWDSSFVGYIYCTRARALECFGGKRLTQSRILKIKSYLISEIEEYDAWLTGDTYAFEQICKKCGDTIDACSGYYGDSWTENGLLETCDVEAKCPVCSEKEESEWELIQESVM